MFDSSQPHGLYPPRFLLCPWNSPGKNTGVGGQFLLQRIFLTQGLNLGLLYCRQTLYHLNHQGSPTTQFGGFKYIHLVVQPSSSPISITFSVIYFPLWFIKSSCSLSRVRLFATLWTVAHQTPPSMAFSRQGYWNGLPFPPPGDLPNLWLKCASSSLAGGFFTTGPPGKPRWIYRYMSKTDRRQIFT